MASPAAPTPSGASPSDAPPAGAPALDARQEGAPALDSREEWRWGKGLVLAAGMGYGVSTFHTASLSTFIPTLAKDVGWSRGEITGPLILVGVAGLLLNPFVGKLVDRVSPRRIALVSVFLYAAALVFLGMSGPSLWSWYAAWGFLAVIFPTICPLVWTAGVVSWFRRSRGLALGAMLCGSGIAMTVTPLVTVYALEAFGWRGAYFTLAAIALAITLPLTWLFFRRPRPNAAPPAQDAAAEPGVAFAEEPGLTLAQALRTPAFWKLAFAFPVAAIVASAMQIHLQPLLIDGGMTATRAALVASAIGPALIVGRLSVGFLLDRFHAPYVAAGGFFLPLVGCTLLLAYDGSVWLALASAILVGLGYGAEIDLLSYISSRYFGVRNYAAIFGALLGVFSVGFTLGPMVAGIVFDRAGSYDTLLMAAMPVSLAVIALILSLGRYPADQAGGAHL